MGRLHRTARFAMVVAGCAALFAGCLPGRPTAQPVSAPRGPTLAEYVDTNAVYAGQPGAVGNLIADVFGDLGPHAVGCVTAIVNRESTGVWWAYNPSTATGLTQIKHPMHDDVAVAATGSSDLFNPWVNLETMRAMSHNVTDEHDWTPAPAACR